MLISDDFVLLHPPKTGGSFVAEAVRTLYSGHEGRTLISHEKHGAIESIPLGDRGKQLVVTVRNPFDYYASRFQFGYWIDRDVDAVSRAWWDSASMPHRFASYPYLTFEEFIEGSHECRYRSESHEVEQILDDLDVGPVTLMMLRFSVPGYLDLLKQVADGHDINGLKRSIGRVRFLHTESLNREVFRWLLDLRVSPDDADLVLFKPRVQPLNTPDSSILRSGHGQPRHKHWSWYFNDQTLAAVVKKEWLFFELFPEYSWITAPDVLSRVAERLLGRSKGLASDVPDDSPELARLWWEKDI